MPHKRRICFVTGTRAEFGLMRKVLDAIRISPRLTLQIVVTGMHLDARHGNSASDIPSVSATVPWTKGSRAKAVGNAIVDLSICFARLKPDIVLIVGDRVEPLAAATAAHLMDIPIAHIHGGDRAMGQADDSLRHAISKLSHIHFPATTTSAARLAHLGEDAWRIHRVGSPGIENIASKAGDTVRIISGKYAMLILHPLSSDDRVEQSRANLVAKGALRAGFNQIVVIYPNNDPGSGGIIRYWRSLEGDPRFRIFKTLARPTFLGLLKRASALIGNSSSGIIEAGSFGTPVVDIGDRQKGRERNKSVVHCNYNSTAICRAILQSRRKVGNVYQGRNTSTRIADILGRLSIDERLLRKVIAY